MGEVVSFTIAQRNDFNAEFIINGNPNKRIWLSQLNRIFLSADDSKLYSGTINYRDGRRISLGVMSVDDFVNAVKDKRFRVEVSNDLYAIDFWNSKCQGLGTCGAIRDYICKALDEERYNDVEGMTKSMTCYSFYEE